MQWNWNTYILWYRNTVSLGSPETEERRSPRLTRKRSPSILIGPRVSIAMKEKMCATGWSRHFLSQCCGFCCFTITWRHCCGWRVGAGRGVDNYCDVPCAATSILSWHQAKPTGRFTSPLNMSVGLVVAGTSARFKASPIAPRIMWWRMERPVLLLQDNPES